MIDCADFAAGTQENSDAASVTPQRGKMQCILPVCVQSVHISLMRHNTSKDGLRAHFLSHTLLERSSIRVRVRVSHPVGEKFRYDTDTASQRCHVQGCGTMLIRRTAGDSERVSSITAREP